MPTFSSALTFSCTLSPTRNYDGVTPRQMEIEVDRSVGEVIIRDDVGPKLGMRAHKGDIDRLVGTDLCLHGN
ncbi:MAG: hypothetical protein OXC60_08340 [Litoreibacter sp.]|nr:hypothetical protein [Litoreibacter sp.]